MRSSLTFFVALVVGLTLLLGSATSESEASDTAPTLFGIATENWADSFDAFEAESGVAPAFHQLFFTFEATYPLTWVDSWFTNLHARGSIPFVEITTNDLAGLDAGSYASNIDAMVDQFAAWLDGDRSRRMLLAPLPEANLSHHPWGGDPQVFVEVFEMMQAEFASRGIGEDQVRFVFWMNGLSSAPFTYHDFYPGHDAVDVLAFSKINRGEPWRDYEETFGMHITEMQQVSRTKPILVAQTGTVESGARRAGWLTDMFHGLASEEQVIGAIYFNRDKQENGTTYDYRILIDGQLDATAASLVTTWSTPSESAWIFDGRMDAWEAARADDVVFVDAVDSPFYQEILWMADQGITQGCDENLFCPDAPVTRAQMASFLIRALPDGPSDFDFFTDDDGSVHEPNINGMAHAEITLGCGDGIYCPDELVTRAQMASFLVRALNLPWTGTDFFDDDTGLTHESNINRLAAAEVTLGCGNRSFCPDAPVNRGQMAAFLFRALAG